MMKKLLAIGCIAAVFTAISCQKEAEMADSAPATGKFVPVTVRATVPETRVSLDGSLPVWTKGDQIGVFTADKVLCPPFAAQTGGSSSTTFSGEKPERSHLATAFFPYDANAGLGDAGLSLTLPQSQSGKIADAVMVGTGNENEGFSFKNVCALLRMNVPSSLGVRKIEVVRDDRVTGPFTVGSDFSISSPSPTSYLEKRAEVAGASALSGEILISVLPSTSKLLQMALTRADGKVAFINTTFTSGKAYEAGRIKNLGQAGASLTFHDAALIADPAEKQL
jgi:hypothetical protein